MGFITGFIGGLTTTYAILYLSLHLHRSNRQHQSLLLTQQKSLLTSLYSPESYITDSPAYEIRKVGLTEELKDRWNRELSNVVHNLQETDWEEVRLRWERRAGNIWQKVKGSEVVQVAEQRFSEGIVGSGAVGDGVEEARELKVAAVGGKRLLELPK